MTDRLREPQEIFARPMVARLVSPNNFDGRGEVPDKVNAAAKQIAHRWVKFVSQWDPAMPNPLTAKEVEQLFTATAIQSEWMRELHEAVHESPAIISSLREENVALRGLRESVAQVLIESVHDICPWCGNEPSWHDEDCAIEVLTDAWDKCASALEGSDDG